MVGLSHTMIIPGRGKQLHKGWGCWCGCYRWCGQDNPLNEELEALSVNRLVVARSHTVGLATQRLVSASEWLHRIKTVERYLRFEL